DNLVSDEFYNAVVIGERIWAATNRGLLTFRKDIIDFDCYTVRPVIKTMRVGGKKVLLGEKNHFEFGKNDLFVNFRSSFLKNPSRVRYRYRLKQHDPWTYTSYHSFEQIGLSYGTYILEIEASLDGRSWAGLEVKPASFAIGKPWWRGTVFSLGVTMAIILLLMLLFHWRSVSIKKKEALKRHILKLEYTALRVQLNPHFLFNSLNTINSYVLDHDRFEASRYLTKYSRLMRLVLDNSMESWVSLEKEIETLKTYIDIEALRASAGFEYHIDCDDRLRPEQCAIPPMLIQPFVENAIWHGLSPLAGEKGILNIRFLYENSRAMTCLIRDNGVGREYTKQQKKTEGATHRSHGMSLIRQRLALMGKIKGESYYFTVEDGTVDATTRKSALLGTTIEIRLPLKLRQ
ncbi:MAG: histidine kinase, partial [Bacteroidota bacterium]